MGSADSMAIFELQLRMERIEHCSLLPQQHSCCIFLLDSRRLYVEFNGICVLSFSLSLQKNAVNRLYGKYDGARRSAPNPPVLHDEYSKPYQQLNGTDNPLRLYQSPITDTPVYWILQSHSPLSLRGGSYGWCFRVLCFLQGGLPAHQEQYSGCFDT